jgi:hypothetical protein
MHYMNEIYLAMNVHSYICNKYDEINPIYDYAVKNVIYNIVKMVW